MNDDVDHAGDHNHHQRHHDVARGAEQRAAHPHDILRGQGQQGQRQKIGGQRAQRSGHLEQGQNTAPRGVTDHGQAQGHAYGHGNDQTGVALSPRASPRPQGLADRGHGPGSKRHTEHHKKGLKLSGKSDGGLNIGINPTRHPNIGQPDDHSAQHHHRLGPDQPPDGAEGHDGGQTLD